MSLQTLLKRGFSPALNSINNFLLYLSKTRRFSFIIQFFSQLTSNEILVNSETHSIVSWSLLKLHKFDEAEEFIRTHFLKSSIFPKNRVLNSVIQGFCIECDNPDKALIVLRDLLRNHGAFPSSFTFCSLIHRFIARGNMGKAIEVLEMMTNEKVNYPFDNFVCSAVISGFCRIGKPELALAFFENALSSGALWPNVVTYTTVVSALCKLGRVSEVSDLVSRMEDDRIAFDVVFYSNWICGYLREGELMTAFQEHTKMVERGINPDTASYTILIDGFSKAGNIEKAVGFLGRMIKEGVKPNLITYTAIVRGFCKKGNLEEAFAFFKKALYMGIEVDEFIYATLIDGICRKGDLDRVFCMLAEMERKGIKPSIVTYNTVINGLCKSGRTSEADKVSKGLQGDMITYSTLLLGYTEEENTKGLLETKQRFEEAGIHMDLVMCNILLKALFMMGAFEDADALYKEMPEMDLSADSVTYHIMIKGYCKAGRIEEALEVFDEFRKTSVSSVACYDLIVNALCKKEMLDAAIEVVIELCEKGLPFVVHILKTLLDATFGVGGAEGVLNLVYRLEGLRSGIYCMICNDAIHFLCRRGSSDAARKVYMVMKRKGLGTKSKSYYSLLMCLLADANNSLSRPFINVYLKENGLVDPMVRKMLLYLLCLKDVDKALRFLRMMRDKDLDVTFPSTVLKKLVEDGKPVDAYELIMGAEDNLTSIDIVDYSIVVDGLCKEGYLVKALDLCDLAIRKGITLNIITYNSVINGLCQQSCLFEAFRLFDSLESIGLVPSEITYAILMDSLCKEGFLEDAKKLFDRMVLKGLKPNIHVYNSMIYGYCKFGQVKEAQNLIPDLDAKGATPDGFTVSSMINGYCLKGDMEGALDVFAEFKRKQISPDLLGYLYLMKGFCTKGRMEEARSVLREVLQSESVLELISKVDTEVESESIKSFLIDLCERGSIHQAVTILEEIASMFFPAFKRLRTHRGSLFPNKHYGQETPSRTDQGSVVYNVNEQEHNLVEKCNGIGKGSCLSDFDRFYSVIGSLCLKGELQQANRLVKAMLSDMHG